MILPHLLLTLAFAVPPQTLAPYLDHSRLLLVFAPSASDGRLHQQLAELASHSADMKERDLIVLPQLPDKTGLRAKYHVSRAGFTLILIGKDGGEKLRQQSPISYARLAETIDAMPMRQDEMRRKQ